MAVPASLATAQFTAVIPNLPSPMATTEGNSSNAFPWGRGGAGILIQTLYDSSHFTSQGITYPILITGLQWRLNGNATSNASTQSTGSTVALSTSPLDASAPSATFASNRGADYTVCWSGVQSWPAAAATPGPTPFSISTPFSTNFVYDPNLGDLNIETDIPIQTFTGSAVQLDVQSTGSLASRVYLTTGYVNGAPNATGTINLNHGVVVEITYIPAAGLYRRSRALRARARSASRSASRTRPSPVIQVASRRGPGTSTATTSPTTRRRTASTRTAPKASTT